MLSNLTKLRKLFQGKSLLNEPMRYDVLGDSVLEYNVTGLQPDTKYSIQVAALTRKGDGDRSPPVNIKTPGGVPNRPALTLKYVLTLKTEYLRTILTIIFFVGSSKGNQR